VTDFLIADRYPVSLAYEQTFLAGLPPAGLQAGGVFSVDTLASRHIGWTSLYRTDVDNRSACFAIAIGEEEYRDKGYGGDAVDVTLAFAFEEMNLHRVWLTTVEYNERAIRCYRRCGFQEEARLRADVFRHGRYWEFVEMGILRHEFAARQKEATHAPG
jgi:RimJ/RimL family protein N-acetyltransferase